MATITIGPTSGVTQKFYVAYIGATLALNSTNFTWYTSDKVAGVYTTSTNRQGYIFTKPGAPIPGVTQLVAVATGLTPNVYELNLKTQVVLDASQFLVVGTNGTLPDDTATIAIPAGGDLVSETYEVILTQRAKDIVAPAPPSNISKVEYRLAGGTYGSLAALKTAITAQPIADFSATGAGSRIQVRLTRTNLLSASTFFTISY